MPNYRRRAEGHCQSATFKRLSTTTVKLTPSKSSLHEPIPYPRAIFTRIHAEIEKNASALRLGRHALHFSSSNIRSNSVRNTFKVTPVIVSEDVLPTCPELSPSSPLFPYSNPLRRLSPRRSPLGENAAKAFVETDTFLKLRERTFEIGGKTYNLTGIEGVGMIHPDMRPPKRSGFSNTHGGGCTRRNAWDASRRPHPSLREVSERYHPTSYTGASTLSLWMGKCRQTINHCAPNGAGALKAPEIDEETDKESYRVFRDELTTFTQVLAQLAVRDGERATRKFVKIAVKGAPHYENAHAIASNISALVKTALYGHRHHSFQVI
ncbi:hypothetical protein F5887DRAFT_1202007 [Amanita rubescens]|nr:hypothetical protein F5887DRAFT_1202007 [Amanita rubescens]